jgi:hypothetical protein
MTDHGQIAAFTILLYEEGPPRQGQVSRLVGDPGSVITDLGTVERVEQRSLLSCPGASEQNASGAGPYTGQCIVTMDANKQVSVVGDAIAP